MRYHKKLRGTRGTISALEVPAYSLYILNSYYIYFIYWYLGTSTFSRVCKKEMKNIFLYRGVFFEVPRYHFRKIPLSVLISLLKCWYLREVPVGVPEVPKQWTP